jgi:hypothetical protein
MEKDAGPDAFRERMLEKDRCIFGTEGGDKGQGKRVL